MCLLEDHAVHATVSLLSLGSIPSRAVLGVAANLLQSLKFIFQRGRKQWLRYGLRPASRLSPAPLGHS